MAQKGEQALLTNGPEKRGRSHELELARATGPVDSNEMLQRAIALLPDERHGYRMMKLEDCSHSSILMYKFLDLWRLQRPQWFEWCRQEI